MDVCTVRATSAWFLFLSWFRFECFSFFVCCVVVVEKEKRGLGGDSDGETR